mmetsp:Transcript_27842/g.83005  ORF Transcript_27842/g.83005 Transcript_27842/m.83005 type:complete len:204 (-) Transcript_27842:1848-2459(-)
MPQLVLKPSLMSMNSESRPPSWTSSSSFFSTRCLLLPGFSTALLLAFESFAQSAAQRTGLFRAASRILRTLSPRSRSTGSEPSSARRSKATKPAVLAFASPPSSSRSSSLRCARSLSFRSNSDRQSARAACRSLRTLVKVCSAVLPRPSTQDAWKSRTSWTESSSWRSVAFIRWSRSEEPLVPRPPRSAATASRPLRSRSFSR